MNAAAAGRAIERHNFACLEAMWTYAQAMAWAESFWPSWPARRWRVEGGRGGASRMLTQRKGEELQRRVGGRLVEVIPAKKARPRDPTCEVDHLVGGAAFVRFCSPRCPGKKRPGGVRKRKAAAAIAGEASP